jgi:hypothetical protein
MAKKNVQKQESKPTQNAALRIESLELRNQALLKMIESQQKSILMLSEEIDKNRELVLGVARRLNTAITVAENSPLTHENVNKEIVNQNVKNLESSVNLMIDEKVITKKDSDGQITDTDFVVGREVNDNGQVVNPRLQFSIVQVSQLENGEELVKLYLGKKVGDIIKKEGDASGIEILEVYSINEDVQLEGELQA